MRRILVPARVPISQRNRRDQRPRECAAPLPQRVGCVASLRGNQLRIPAASTDIGVLPVPMEPGINLTVVAGDLSETQEHPANTRGTE
jgi:hypothetical protein